MKPSLPEESDEDRYNDEEGLEDEATGNGKGVLAAKMAPVVEAVEVFQPRRGLLAKVPQAGEVVGEHRADGAGQ